MPTFFMAVQNQHSKINWGYHAEKSTTSSKSMKRGCYWPRGRMLGGSHGINSMFHIRGHDRDYNHWEKLGNKGWGWQNVLHYFKKCETMKLDKLATNTKYHGTSGPLKMDHFHNTEPMRDIIFDAAKELGYEVLPDINAGINIGMTEPHGTLDGNRRLTTAKAYLVPAMNRPNLKVIKNAHVTKVLINEKKEATGVEFILENRRMTVNINKEVIVSAGAVNTAKILMLSGVGPEKHLKMHKISTIADLPVGKHLEDHMSVIFPMAINAGNSSEASSAEFVDSLYKYLNNQVGPSGLGIFDVLGFFNTVDRNDPYPDVELVFLYFKKGGDVLLPHYIRDKLGLEEHIVSTIIDANQESDILIILNILLNPKSEGKIELRSADPFDAPRIDPNYLSDYDDVNTMIRSLKLSKKFMNTKVFKEHKVTPINFLPECDALKTESDAYYECYVRHMSNTLYHSSGTAKMGPNSDKAAVVDERLRVKGIKNLRVADASIIPKIPSGHTQAPVIMIGEKAADLIKEDHGANIHTEL